MEYGYLSDIGNVRKLNEDNGGFFKNPQGLFLGLVADGIGGNQGGDVASSMVTSHLGYLFDHSKFIHPEEAYEWLQHQVQIENDLLIRKGEKYLDLRGMGTTLVCILGNDHSCIIANIGDSRGYRYRNDKLLQITQDHSLVNELVREGALTKEEAKHSPQKNIIIRTLGISKEAQMDCHTLNIQEDDIFLLCSDGLSKLVSDDDMICILKQELDLDTKCEQLVSLARQNGGNDNITVLLVARKRR